MSLSVNDRALIPFLGGLSELFRAGNPQAVEDILWSSGLILSIDQVNWPDFADPEVRVAASLAHDKDMLALSFRVREPEIRAETTQDQGPVYEDSCVEFFVSAGQGYWNFELNPLGSCLLYYGPSRETRTPLGPMELSRLIRLPRIIDAENWRLSLGIPKETFGSAFREENSWSCNLYKCGDRLLRPHYLSWAPIQSRNPDFHRPECFRNIEFTNE